MGSTGDPEEAGLVGRDPACEVSGNVCLWLGVPGVADLTPASLYLPADVTFAQDGAAYVADAMAHRILRVGADGDVTTISGIAGRIGDGPLDGTECRDGCDALSSAWNEPSDVALDPSDPDRLWVAAWHNSRVNVLDLAAGTMTWTAGTAEYGYADGVLVDAVFDRPSSLAFADDGNLYVSDQKNHVIRRVTPAGTVERVAGEPGVARFDGDGGPAAEAHLFGDPTSDVSSKLAIDGHRLYVADTMNGMVRVIDLDTLTIDAFAGRRVDLEDSFGRELGSRPGYDGDGREATEALMAFPVDVAVGIEGEVYVADTGNHCVRVVTDGVIHRFAGICDTDEQDEPAYAGDGGPALEAEFGEIYGVAVDAGGDVYVTDTENQVIRRVKR